MRADPPLANARTCSTVAIVVSPGNVVSSAPCAQPSFTASSRSSPAQQAVDEARREAVAAADAIDARSSSARGRRVRLAVDPRHRAPAVAVRGVHFAQRGRDDLHLADTSRRRCRSCRRRRWDRASTFGRTSGPGMPRPILQVLFVADQHIDVLDDARDHRRAFSSPPQMFQSFAR